MLKKMSIGFLLFALIGIFGNQVYAEYSNTGVSGVNTSNTTHYQGNITDNNRTRTTAVDTTPRRTNWGWLGLLGLAGLAGLRGRNTNPDPERHR
jgi:MYXO-CTERM domain-containing protein